MKIIFYIFFLSLYFQGFSTNPDSTWSVSYLENLDEAQRWPIIKSQLSLVQKDEKKAKLKYIIQVCKSAKWPRIEAEAEQSLGVYFYKLGEYVDALNHYQKAIELFEKLNDSSGLGSVYNLVATLSKKQKDYKRAHDYLDKTLALCVQAKDSACISTVFDNRGLIYAELQDFKKAKEHYLITLDIRKKIKDTIGLGYVYSNLAEVASHEQTYELAEQYILQSNKYKALSSDRFGEAVNFTNLGEMYFKQKKYRKAARFFQQSLHISKQLGVADLSQWNYRFLSRCFSGLGDTEQALNFLNKSHQLKDSLLTVEKLSQITEMETRFDTDRKEQQIKMQELEIENQKQLNRNQLLMGLVFISVLSLGFLLLHLIYRNRQKNKIQEAQIIYQQDLLTTAIQTQEEERLRISKDLHDGIGQQLSGLKMAWQQLGKSIKSHLPEKTTQLDDLNHILSNAAEEIRSISHQMMPKALQEYGLVAASEDLLEKAFKHSSIQYDFGHYQVEGRFSKNIELSTYRILQELINNIIKHSQATEVSVQFMKSKNHLVMAVEDNGIGVKTNSSKAGHGMKNMQSRAQLVKGTLDFDTTNPGTLVTLRIPLIAT